MKKTKARKSRKKDRINPQEHREYLMQASKTLIMVCMTVSGAVFSLLFIEQNIIVGIKKIILVFTVIGVAIGLFFSMLTQTGIAFEGLEKPPRYLPFTTKHIFIIAWTGAIFGILGIVCLALGILL